MLRHLMTFSSFILLAATAQWAPASAQNAQVISILVLYTDKASVELERRGRRIEDEIAFIGHMQNRIFASSGARAQVTVKAQPWNEFNEDSHVLAHLRCDPSSLNCMDTNLQVPLLDMIAKKTSSGGEFSIGKHRKQASADLDSLRLWRGGWDTLGGAGSRLIKADLAAGPAAAAGRAYLSLIAVEKAWLWWHFAHEIGPNFGLGDDGHDADELIERDGFGHVDTAFPFRTVMAGDGACNKAGFAACLRIPLYSNVDPAVTYLGFPIGKPGYNEAATINKTASFVAQYSDHLP